MDHDDLLSFGPYLLDVQQRRVTRDDADVRMASRHFDLLCYLAQHAGTVVEKELLVRVTWHDTPVTTGSLDQALHQLRRLLPMPSGEPLIETQTRRGIKFLPPVTRVPRRAATDESIETIMAAHQSWIEGKAALETLNTADIMRARAAFERAIAEFPQRASAHVGLANAHALQFEMTRADEKPDSEALQTALTHALKARELDQTYGEAWATLGFILERLSWLPASAGLVTRQQALAAHQQSVTLEPDNWRHWLRLAACSWGEERIRAARRALQLMPGLAVAHVLVATVFVARGLLAQALAELRQAITAAYDEANGSPYGCPAAHWLSGLIQLAFGHRDDALMAFRRELDQEHNGHLYAREVTANTWYAIGAVHYHCGDADQAQEAFLQCIKRVPRHPLARAALGGDPTTMPKGVERRIAETVAVISAQNRSGYDIASACIERALAEAAPGNVAWLLPVEPMLVTWTAPEGWRGALARVRSRAA